MKRPINYIVDIDIKGFFNHVDHEWMIKFIEHRITDPNIIRLIKRFLKAGIMEEGVKYDTTEGTQQGGSASPVLSNIYLHYVIDLWFEKIVRKRCRGVAYMVRYADDNIFCFKYEEEAKAFYRALPERLGKFGLELSAEKSKIIAFGRNAGKKDGDDSGTSGSGKPETFDFLGFKHYCSKSRKGKFRVKRKTSNKKYRASLHRFKLWLYKNMHTPTEVLMKKLVRKLQGHFQYYGITDNTDMLRKFIDEIKRYLFKSMNRRSQKRSYNWDNYPLLLEKYPLPRPKIHVNIYELKDDIGYIM